ncbi:MAG: 16S rRNA (guanine(966)-N(2))-methyltransferase RsmD [Holophagales bacterium]|nr:16S rRNA (guanine(966)-N(2))-methyltransferase RsmD [Holophagales bacterium]MYG32119.1 16S rRNA (guanine(966)-N(2))-methyltransferase RsmD [Holophagales bacterium]MYI80829.1 16S rRNA (guanine(966)-N(2))-methyltransferase RsmD [Holophagales bacterium]
MSRRQTGSGTRSGGMKVLGGRWRGRRLTAPAGVRPTQARVREALFSHWGDRVRGGRLLELYAGSGAVSFEALSRGAGFALAVDRSSRAQACMKASRDTLATDDLRLVRAVLPAGLEEAVKREAAFDLVFIDPPYDDCGLGELLDAVSSAVAHGGEIVLEHASRQAPPAAAGRFRLRRTRRYGDSALAFYA